MPRLMPNHVLNKVHARKIQIKVIYIEGIFIVQPYILRLSLPSRYSHCWKKNQEGSDTRLLWNNGRCLHNIQRPPKNPTFKFDYRWSTGQVSKWPICLINIQTRKPKHKHDPTSQCTFIIKKHFLGMVQCTLGLLHLFMLTWYLPGRSGPLKKTDVKPLYRNGDHVSFVFSAWLLPISRLASRKVCFPGCRIYRPFPLIRTVLLSFVSSEIVSALCCWPLSLLLTYHEEVSCTDWSKLQLVSSCAIPRIHQFLMFCGWHLGVCWLGRHMIAETSAVWLEMFFPCFTCFCYTRC